MTDSTPTFDPRAAREQRGLAIAATCKLEKKDAGLWVVPSQSGCGKYYVRPDKEVPSCTCPDHQELGHVCKHIHAVKFVIQRELFPDGTIQETRSVTMTETVVRKTYRQQWPAYNAAQVNEKERFQTLLRDLCRGLPDPECNKPGRPRLPLSDALFSAIFKVYSTVSGRRFMTDLRGAHEKGLISKLPCYNSIFNVFDSEATTDVLLRLVAASAAPLKSLESNFACDSSGFSASRFDRWFSHKHGKQRIERTWVKCHIMCGVHTNVITAVEIHGRSANDSPFLPVLLETTRKQFDVKEVSADMGYSSESNLRTITAAGAACYIPFKSNVSGAMGGLWEKMYHFFKFNKEEFLARYHQRSNVESTFHMLKSKFGDSVRSKLPTSMKNEVLAKIVAHNICCIIQAMYELGIDPVFWGSSQAG